MCKDFFRFCTGFGKKSFNKLLKYVENYAVEGRPESPYDKYFRKDGLQWVLCGRATLHLPEEIVEDIDMPYTLKPVVVKQSDTDLEYLLIFLDDHFERSYVDRDPATRSIRYVRTLWIVVHDKYSEYCIKMRLKPLGYERSCELRYYLLMTL